MDKFEIQSQVGVEILNYFPTGSNFICDPPVTDTDIDYMVLIPTESTRKIKETLRSSGWDYCGKDYSEHRASEFFAVRKNNYNLILTENPRYFLDFQEATSLAKKLNLREKHQRIGLFDYILNGWNVPDSDNLEVSKNPQVYLA